MCGCTLQIPRPPRQWGPGHLAGGSLKEAPPPPAHAHTPLAGPCPCLPTRGAQKRGVGLCLSLVERVPKFGGPLADWAGDLQKNSLWNSGTALSSGEYATHQCYPGNSQSDDAGKNAATPSRADSWVLFPPLRLVNGAARLRVESAGNLDQRFHDLRTDRRQDLLNLLFAPLPRCRLLVAVSMGKLKSGRTFRRRRPTQCTQCRRCRHMTSLGTCRISRWSQQAKRGPRPAVSARACCARRERRSPPAAAGAHGRRREPRQLHGSPKRVNAPPRRLRHSSDTQKLGKP
jgi:hypothetical protein